MFWRKKQKNANFISENDLPKGAEDSDSETRAKNIIAIIDYLTDGVLVFDNYARITFINPEASKILGIDPSELIGQHIFKLSQSPNAQKILPILSGETGEIIRKEVDIRDNFILEASVIPMIVDGKKTGGLVILHDITRDKMVQKMKSEFVTVAAHQLRTPASIVKWTMDMLINDSGSLGDDQKKLVVMAYHTNEKIIRLINDLLDVAQIEEGRFLSRVVLSDFMKVLDPIIETHRQTAQRKKITFVFNAPHEDLPKLMIDEGKMKIAINNIIDNSVVYTPERGKIEAGVFYDKKNKEIIVAVKDSGAGIPEVQQKNIFSKFFRGSNAVRIDTEGTGLGLFISKNIIEAHGGRIWFESQEGKGAIFYFTIPVKGKFAEFLTKDFY